MHAAVTVTHRSGDFLSALKQALPPDDRACLANSVVFSQEPRWGEIVAYAAETPEWRLIVYPDGPDQWQMVVELVHGDLRKSCESVWRSVRKAASSLSPKLERLDVYDGSWTRTFLKARVGFFPELRKGDLWIPLIAGVATAVVLALSKANSDVVLGAIPSLVAAVGSMAAIILDALRKKLVWSA